MKTKEEIKAKIDEIAEQILVTEKANESLRACALFNQATALYWVLDKDYKLN